MTKHEKNVAIAKILGFEFYEGKLGEQVRYPKEWEDEISSQPVRDIPDFVEMLSQSRKIAKIYQYGIPTDFNLEQI